MSDGSGSSRRGDIGCGNGAGDDAVDEFPDGWRGAGECPLSLVLAENVIRAG